jgi:diketogulonate reductase-like aldo/keto reductase
MQSRGLARTIGVSNFQPAHLERVIEETGVTPVVNQVELHPYFQQADLRRVHADLGVATEAWSPLAQGQVLDDPAIVRIAEAHGKTPGQTVIRWHLQLGNVVIPKSVTPKRIEDNFAVFDFELDESEMREIEALDSGDRIGPDPDKFVRP